LSAVVSTATLFFADWGQFRGPNSSGVSPDINLPGELRPDRLVVWKTAIPPGYSSPSVAGDRIFLTAVENEKLFTLCLDRASGRILWRREVPRPRQQEIQRANTPVSATPATDGKSVYSFFQDFGLIAYGPDGNELWRLPMGPFNNPFGHGSSPVLAGDTLLMNIDQDTGSFLLALDRKTGKTLWKTARDHAQRGYATPVLHGKQVLIAGSYRLSGYDLATGREVWWIAGLPWQIKPTPIVQDGVLYFVTFSGESDPGEQEKVPPFAEALQQLDKNKDGRIAKDEIVDAKAKARFDEYLDLDHTGYLEERDWERFRDRRLGESALRAYRIGADAKGDMTESGFLWKNSKTLPNVPSPLFYQGVLYTLKEGGIFTSFDPKTGAVLKQARLQGALGGYSASPIAADGKIYLANEDGKTVVLKAGAQWEILSVGEFEAGIKATPAITGGRIYLRTHAALYCFDAKVSGDR
jgi:outer membrane protein assembly factor BamB